MRSIPRRYRAVGRIHLVPRARRVALCGDQPGECEEWRDPEAQATCPRCLVLQKVLHQVEAAAPMAYRTSDQAERSRLRHLARLALLDQTGDGWALREAAPPPKSTHPAEAAPASAPLAFPKHEPLVAADWVSFLPSRRARRRLTGTVAATSFQMEIQGDVVDIRHCSGRLFAAIPRDLVRKLSPKAVQDEKDLRAGDRPPRRRSTPRLPAPVAPAPAPDPSEAVHVVPVASPLRPVPKAPPPVRSVAYLDFVRTWCCLICDAPALPVDAHHVGRHPLGQKVSDLFAVPLCRRCHDHLHRAGCLPGYSPQDSHDLLRGAIIVLLAEWHEELMRLLSPPAAGALSPEERAYVEYLCEAEVVHGHA